LLVNLNVLVEKLNSIDLLKLKLKALIPAIKFDVVE
jgi:hypothetical protein